MTIDSNIEYVHGIPENIETMFMKDQTNLIVLDDMMDEASKNDKPSGQKDVFYTSKIRLSIRLKYV